MHDSWASWLSFTFPTPPLSTKPGQLHFSPIGSGLAIVISGGYLWIDNRRHKTRETAIPNAQETQSLQVYDPFPQLTDIAVHADTSREPASRPETLPALADPEEVFVDLPPHDLIAPFEKLLNLHAEREVQRYIGKKYRATGGVSNVSKIGRYWYIMIAVANPNSIFETTLRFRFDPIWTARVELLDKGTKITAIGTIQALSTKFIDLVDGHFVT